MSGISIVFIVLIFLFTIGSSLILKVCATNLNHRTAPIFISVYLLFGIFLTLPWFHPLLLSGFSTLFANPIILLVCILKGFVLWYNFVESQKLKQHSLSSFHYVGPLGLSIAAFINSFLGENLTATEWIGIIGMCVVGVGFFLKGHLNTLNFEAKILYFKLVCISAVLIVIDHYTVSHTNWYVLIFIVSITMFCISLAETRGASIWKKALFSRIPALAGLSFVMYEFIKFYPMVTILPVSVISMVTIGAIPIILLASALIWKEGRWQEQIIWGLLSMLFIFVLIL
jgi:hypothetical protein